MKSKNCFSVIGDSIHISRAEWCSSAQVTYKEDYCDEIQSVTWSLNNGYVYNSKLGYLHRYIAGKWYGEQVLNDMTKNGFVIDHMDNNNFNCEIDNLSFLSSNENKAKGFTLDEQSERLRHKIALNLFRDFSTGNYQVTIFFNKQMFLYNTTLKTLRPVSALSLLYTSKYEIVINDARYILLAYESDGRFELGKLNCSDYFIEETITLNLDKEDQERVVAEVDGMQYLVISDSLRMEKIPFIKGWMPGTRK